ncbi:beta-glucosidase [Actinoplanes sp. OR16]|uniref:glycoside hydrolase family 3 protein n=1 Tax=Actinoplanes sp. OR16 TaxID=946334 RepID=UPI000F6BF4C1|nr:glycoside hydrolase family 3 N-terminal domain-containing protein [Actinoplanes sp. OR16]BBH67344.1 beta-glucosidase [Actinoplanes sp. OR16]
MHPYQDVSLSMEQRVEDLLSRMTLADKAGLLFQQIASIGDFDAPGIFGSASVRELLDQGLTHFNILFAPGAREIAEWHNALQDEALKHPLGIPVTISSDPRHSFTDNPATALLAGPFAQFPEPLGLAAIGSEELVARFADLTRREYLAVGIRAALHPQIDLATEPRWARQSATFGEDAELSTRLGVAYIKGLQAGTSIGPSSVSVMAKHFPGGGPQKDGEDPHFSYGREQVYPGDQFELHLGPFEAAIEAGVAQLMPYYGMPVGLAGVEEVGFGFNKDIITGLLRERLGYDGIVCTDWGILSNTCWGVEHLSYEERMIKALEAGVDQFGGESRADVLVSLVKDGSITESRLDVSVRRLLREKFRLGLFEQPYVDADAAGQIVGTAEAREEGIAAQAAAHTLLINAAEGPARLPLAPGLRVYAEGVSDLGERAVLVSDISDADVAVLKLSAPFEQRGDGTTVESFFRAGSLAFPDAEIERIARICATVPTIVDVYLDRPAILAPLASSAATLLANFGASEEAIVRVLFGDAEPQGSLPFDIPSSMEAVEAGRPDVPFDTVDPTFRFGHGLRY